MSVDYQSFDSPDVQRSTRRSIALHTGLLFGGLLLTTGCILLISGRPRYPNSWSVIAAVVGAGPLGYVGLRLYRLSHVVWLVKLYDERIDGYDYARRKITVSLDRLKRIDLQSDSSLLLTADSGATIRIPGAFTDFPDLAHAVIARCDTDRTDVYVENRPLERLPVAHLLPQTEGDEPATY